MPMGATCLQPDERFERAPNTLLLALLLSRVCTELVPYGMSSGNNTPADLGW